MQPAALFSYVKDTKAMIILLRCLCLASCFLPACFTENNSGTAGSDPAFIKKLSRLSADEIDTLYAGICRNLVQQQLKLKTNYSGSSGSERKAMLDKSRALLLQTLSDSIFPCWYNTGWDFNGTSTWPQKGNIACGYFVTTVLKQAGFNLNRVKLAQCASSELISAFCPKENVRIITNNQTKKLFDFMKTKADGIYIIGLDNHTGFLVKENGRTDFVHSSYLPEVDKVIREPLEKSTIILANNYFVIGDLSHSDGTIAKWITGEKVE
jgi:hypothetical protein